MDDLTESQEAELDSAVWDFVQDRKLDGLRVVVLISGRGVDKAAYAREDAEVVPTMLAHAYRSTRQYNAERAN